jgi:succinyl-diaminopimelate desuccinylase
MRILPLYRVSDVLASIKSEARKVEQATGAKIKIETTNGGEDAAPPTSTGSEVYRKLASAITEMRGITPKPVGIGGGTCAAIFRNAGYPAVVWTTSDENPHNPDEYIWIRNLVADAKVYAAMFI